MNGIKKRVIKVDKVLVIAWILAIISAFFVRPDMTYISYIDFRSLGILWGLMVIIQGLKENSVFEKIAIALLKRVKNGFQLGIVLVFMCFFGSMLITNDVALITFVPLAIMIMSSCKREDMMIPVIVLQTVAANLGSMLTPIGNPQNLYLYGLTGMKLSEFILTMLPYSLLSAVLLFACLYTVPSRKENLVNAKEGSITSNFGSMTQIIIYTALFVVALLAVVRAIPWFIFAIIVFIVVAGMDFKILFRADYILLLTFIGFFIFTGNMGKIDYISDFLGHTLSGREFPIAIGLSQVISNVPATLMLSGFTKDYESLLIAVNVGGLGTLIASMASLISFKAYTKEYSGNTLKYVGVFTAANVFFLICLVAFRFFMA
ncbi:SLC13 family permease [Butyrivibrio sp. CB08]|uniref:SLC13 family permease n=1 Tax=Butyrivibrio sp. CB08 TaxID=2364879 RepID=UPI001FA97693|nr:SLC13 family permease [Butyrivibrio sp. CB08]